MNYLYGVITNLHRHADFWQVDTFLVIGSWSIPINPIISQIRILLTSPLLTLLKHSLNQIAPCKGTQTGFLPVDYWILDSGYSPKSPKFRLKKPFELTVWRIRRWSIEFEALSSILQSEGVEEISSRKTYVLHDCISVGISDYRTCIFNSSRIEF